MKSFSFTSCLAGLTTGATIVTAGQTGLLRHNNCDKRVFLDLDREKQDGITEGPQDRLTRARTKQSNGRLLWVLEPGQKTFDPWTSRGKELSAGENATLRYCQPTHQARAGLKGQLKMLEAVKEDGVEKLATPDIFLPDGAQITARELEKRFFLMPILAPIVAWAAAQSAMTIGLVLGISSAVISVSVLGTIMGIAVHNNNRDAGLD